MFQCGLTKFNVDVIPIQGPYDSYGKPSYGGAGYSSGYAFHQQPSYSQY